MEENSTEKPLANGKDHTELPQGAAPVVNLEKVINESKAALQAEPPKPKRGRGRPRKILKSVEGQGSSVNAPPQAQASGPVASENASMAPMFSGATKFVCAAIAEAREFPQYNATDAEADMLGDALDQFLKVYLPDSATHNPKAVAGISLGIAVFSIFGLKELQYRSHIQKTGKKPIKKSDDGENENEDAPEKPRVFGALPAHQYFAQPQV